MNLLLCYYALRDIDKLKRHFQRMVLIETGTDYDDDRYYPTDVSINDYTNTDTDTDRILIINKEC